PNVYFMKQTIGNACGTIGLIHAIANNLAHLEFEAGSALKKFVEEMVPMTPEKKAAFLEKDEAPARPDGRKPFPIVHGKTSEDTLLEDAVEVCKAFMKRDLQEVSFTIIALSKDSN
ncbi:ubiquitin carboxyl-terminal hydrolase isozyme L3-like, partial [Brachionichthys hirsutus]|uniref:ubiquitin carboxyl-terminal hydrolase isozyme L3-like n=1 Tax=Brachionichthys hirsutus TaxID=412623 RepID=UPI0036044AD0